MDGPEIDSRELLDRFVAGDPGALSCLVSRWDRRLFVLAYRLLGDRDEALDVRQMAWMRVVQRAGSFSGDGSMERWLARIVVNLCRDRQRQRREDSLEFVGEAALHASADLGPHRQLEITESRRSVVAAMALLPDDERECVVLRHFEGLSMTEVARVLDRPRTTVQSCWLRGMRRLTQVLAPQEPTRNEQSRGSRSHG